MNTFVWFTALLILYLLIIKGHEEKPAGHGFPVTELQHPPEELTGASVAELFTALLELDFDPPRYFRAVESPDHPYALLAQRNIACFALVTVTAELNPDVRLLAFMDAGNLLVSGHELPLPSLKGCPWMIREDRGEESLELWVSGFAGRLRAAADSGQIPAHALVDQFARKMGRLIDGWDELKITRLHTEECALRTESDKLPGIQPEHRNPDQ